jgi:choline dehydrogenase
MTSDEAFDYIIVGAGAAGSVPANRLTENPGATVCVLEAGPADLNPWIRIPAGFTKTLFDPSCPWQFRSEPRRTLAGGAYRPPRDERSTARAPSTA